MLLCTMSVSKQEKKMDIVSFTDHVPDKLDQKTPIFGKSGCSSFRVPGTQYISLYAQRFWQRGRNLLYQSHLACKNTVRVCNQINDGCSSRHGDVESTTPQCYKV